MATLESLEGRYGNGRTSGQDLTRPTSPDTTFGPSNAGPISDAGPDAEEACLNEILSFQDELLELLSMGTTLDEIQKHVSARTERLLHPARCSVHLAESDNNSAARIAEPGTSELTGTRCFGAAGSLTGRLSESSCSRGLKSGGRGRWSLPVLDRNGRLLGYFALRYASPSKPSSRDLQVVDSMAALLRFAIRHHQLERARGHNDERVRSLTSSLPGVVYQWRVTPDGDIRYRYISEGAKTLFGVAPEEVLANPEVLLDCHGPRYRADFRARLRKASRELSLWDVEAPIVTRSGEEKWAHAIASPRRELDGSVIWNGIILDSTRVKRSQIELRHAKNTAEAASKAKMKFLSLMSHELRTPLNAIIGFSGLLKAPSTGALNDQKRVEYADDINSSGIELLRIINDVLEFTNLETGEFNFLAQEVSVEAVIGCAIEVTRPFAQSAQVSVHQNLGEKLPSILGDHEKIRRILTVLLSNAIKFTPPKGKIWITADTDRKGGLRLSIADTGIGIAKEDLDKVFEAFGQVDDEMNRRYEGIGLGIALAKCLAELHDAALSLDSEPGRGTTVRLVFPAHRLVRGMSERE